MALVRDAMTDSDATRERLARCAKHPTVRYLPDAGYAVTRPIPDLLQGLGHSGFVGRLAGKPSKRLPSGRMMDFRK